MAALTDIAARVLAAAADRADRLAPMLPDRQMVVLLNVCTAQIKAGHLERVPAPVPMANDDRLIVSKAAGAAQAFRITDDGMRAIDRNPEPIPVPEPKREPEPTPAQPEMPRPDRSTKGARAVLMKALECAEKVVSAWDAVGEITVPWPLTEAVFDLRIALEAINSQLPGRQTTTPASRGTIRPGSKMARAIDLMSLPGGITGPDLEEALGWASHTVRAFVSTLGKTRVVTRTKLPATDTERACTAYSVNT